MECLFVTSFLCLFLQLEFSQAIPLALPTAASIMDGIIDVNVDPHFAHDPQDLETKDVAKTVHIISGAVMGIAEIVVGIKSDVKLLRKEIMMGKVNGRFEGRYNQDSKIGQLSAEERIRHNLQLADRIEKIFQIENNTRVNLAKEEIKKTIQINFIRVLAAMLINGPPSAQNRKQDIIRLMKSVLNDELDFMNVVEKLPFILRDSDTNQFIHLIQTMKEDEFPIKSRQEDEDDGDDDSETTDTPAAAPITQSTATVIMVSHQQEAPINQPLVVDQIQIAPQASDVVGSNNNQQVQAIPAINPSLNPVSPVVPAVALSTPPTPAPIQTQIIVQQPQQQAPAPPKQTQNGLSQVIQAVSQFDVKQISNFLSVLPELFTGVEGIVEGFENFLIFGE